MDIDQSIADSLQRITELGERILAHLDRQQQERDFDPARIAAADAQVAALSAAIAERDRATSALIDEMVAKVA
jgi:hypothetical protein